MVLCVCVCACWCVRVWLSRVPLGARLATWKEAKRHGYLFVCAYVCVCVRACARMSERRYAKVWARALAWAFAAWSVAEHLEQLFLELACRLDLLRTN